MAREPKIRSGEAKEQRCCGGSSHTNGHSHSSDTGEEKATKSEEEATNALEKLTDIVEEKQLDENKIKVALLALKKQEEADKEAERNRERELAAIQVCEADIAFIANEMEVSRQQAERKLREASGSVHKCLAGLLTA